MENTSQEQVLWQTILGEVQLTLSEGNFKTWFEPASLVEIDGEKITITHPNPFAKNQFEKRFSKDIVEILKNNGFSTPVIECTSKTKKKRDRGESQDIQIPAVAVKKAKNTSGLNPRYQFENFIVGDCNDLAYAAAQAAAAHPGERYNPIFVYGGVGLGKTHLIQAIGNEIISKL
jgi:chromosomal replication initiator protein